MESDLSFIGARSISALRVIRGVLDSAENGHLPLFAATLGMRYSELSIILPEDKIDPMLRSPIHSDLLAKWVPDLFPPLVEMLWDNHSGNDQIDWWVAHAIACACFGQRHLWHDLGLCSRKEVSELFAERFCWLYIRNSGNMNWKQFIFQDLGLRLGIPELSPPGGSVINADVAGTKHGISFLQLDACLNSNRFT